MGKRSPILGYNHNVRYRGLVFHVQTEDSGVDNPHIFTHLFHGGVILNTRKLDYDAEAAEDVVKSLMQAQHKAVLKDLRRGDFTGKIDSYLGEHPDLLPVDAGQEDARAITAPPVDVGALGTDTYAAVDDDEPAHVHAPALSSAPLPPGLQGARPGEYRQHRRGRSTSIPIPPVATVAPPPVPARAAGPRPVSTTIRTPVRSQPPPVPPRPQTEAGRNKRPSTSGVVVSRPAVIIGAAAQGRERHRALCAADQVTTVARGNRRWHLWARSDLGKESR